MILKSDKNLIFGGYTENPFISHKKGETTYNDGNAFAFSLDKKKFIQLKKVELQLDVVIVVVLNFLAILFV